MISHLLVGLVTIVAVVIVPVRAATALPTAFTYQGRLELAGLPADGPCDFEFRLFDAASAGSQVGATQPKGSLAVSDGLFTTTLDFGASAFTGADRFLDISVRCPAGSGAFAPLTPRQPLTPAPYALFSMSAANDSIAGAQILDGAVMTADLANGAVTDAKVTSISFGKITGAPTSLPPSGPAGGALTGTYPNPGIAANAVGPTQLASDPASLGKLTDQYFTQTSQGIFAMDEDARLGIGLPPKVPLHATGSDVGLTAGGILQLGDSTSSNLAFDGTQIQARFDGFASTLTLQALGSNVVIGHPSQAFVPSLSVVGGSDIFPDSPSSGRARIGPPAQHVVLDGNGISSRDDQGNGTVLSLQEAGGSVTVGPTSEVHVEIAQNRISQRSGADLVPLDVPALRVGIGGTGVFPVEVLGGGDASPTGGGSFQVGSATGDNVVIDANEILARSNGATNTLTLQNNGGALVVNGTNNSTGGVAISTPNTSGFDLAVNGTAAKSGGGSWTVLSDRRLKRDVRPLDGALDRLLALRGMTYEFRDPEAIHELPGRQMGFVAQDVERVFPDWIGETTEGHKTLTVRGFEALTVEAVRDLHRENTELRRRLDSLEARLEACATSGLTATLID